jgi:uncharacterized membrane protein
MLPNHFFKGGQMKILSLLALTLFPLGASADIIKCGFTEPFFSTEYSMAQQSLTVIDHGLNTKKVLRNISFQIRGAGHFELWDSNRRVIQKLLLNFEGTDGMSDTIYPYQAEWRSPGEPYGPQNLHGGCTSNFLNSRQGN